MVRGWREGAVSNQYLLRPAEAAQRLAVSRTTLYGLLKDGQIPYVIVGKRMRVPADRLREVIDARITFNGARSPENPIAA